MNEWIVLSDPAQVSCSSIHDSNERLVFLTGQVRGATNLYRIQRLEPDASMGRQRYLQSLG